ncbi:MAG: hypothetical protein J5854_00875 [Clostridia bacterium]|nr:hypothetical protein [Clostridia bacterium]
MLEKKIRINSYDVYPNSIMKPSALMRHMQQIAREDCDGMGATYDYMRSLNTVFVLTKLAIEFVRPVKDGEELTLKTYNNTITGIIFDREYELVSDSGVAARATTLWTLVRYDTRSLVRPSSFPVPFETVNLDIKPIDMPRRIGAEGIKTVGTHTVRTSELDENNHLNNCIYADIALDSVKDFDGLGSWPKSIKLIFRHEARRGDELEISASFEDGVHRVFAKNLNGGAACFETEIRLAGAPDGE